MNCGGMGKIKYEEEGCRRRVSGDCGTWEVRVERVHHPRSIRYGWGEADLLQTSCTSNLEVDESGTM